MLMRGCPGYLYPSPDKMKYLHTPYYEHVTIKEKIAVILNVDLYIIFISNIKQQL